MGTFAKFNQSGKNSASTYVSLCREAISSADTTTSSFVESAKSESSGWLSYVKVESKDYHDCDDDGKIINTWTEYWTNFDDNHQNDPDAAMNTGKSVCTTNYIDPYNKLADGLQTEWNSLKTEVETRIKNVETCLNSIETAATTFDGLSSNISTAIAELEAAGLADNIKVVTEDGVEVMYYQIYDENGQVIGQFSISEMVNSFYTYAGSAMEGAIATGLMFGDSSIPEGYLNNIVSGIGNSVYNLRGQGFMSVAHIDGIEKMYDAIVGDGKYALITDKFNSLLDGKEVDEKVSDLFNKLKNKDTNAALTAGAVFAAGAVANLGAKTYSEENAEETQKRFKQLENKTAEDDEEKKEETTGAENTTEPGTEKPTWTDLTDTGGGGYYPSSGGGGGRPTGGGDPGSTTPVTPENGGTTPETDKRFTDIVETELPSEPLEMEVTNEDIDSLARDEFYDRYSIPEDLAERRQVDIDNFEQLFNAENKDALVNKFIEMGYDPAEALGAANNKDVGLAAFLLGSQNQELTQIAQDFATDLGLGDKFDTSFDNAPDYTDLFDGDAQVELTSPSTNEAIMSAKADVQEAKTAYSESVASANQYIEDATKAKGDLDSLRASIESVSGKDTSKWTEAQITQYNKATETYNTAVTKANEEVVAAGKAKELYTQAKDNLQKIETDYYNEIREAIKQQNGYDSGVSGGSSAITTTDAPNTGTVTGTTTENNPTSETQQVTDQSLIDQLFVNM